MVFFADVWGSTGIIDDMRNEDKAFADIVQKEFDESWTPTPPSREPAPTPAEPVEEAPDFHLNLYDDEESYRVVIGKVTLAPMTIWGLGFIGTGVLFSLARFAQVGFPTWVGWIGIGSFILGIGMCLWHTSHAVKDPENDEGVV